MNPTPPGGTLPPDLLLVLSGERASLLRIEQDAVRALVGIPLSARIGPEVLTGTLRRFLTGPAYRRLLVAIDTRIAPDAAREVLARIRVPRGKQVVWLPALQALGQAAALTSSSPILSPKADEPGEEPGAADSPVQQSLV